MKLKRLIFLALVICYSLAVSAQSKYQSKQATAAGYTYKYVTNDPMATRFYTLKNGLTVVLSPNKREPRISVKIPEEPAVTTVPKIIQGLLITFSIFYLRALINSDHWIGQNKNLCLTVLITFMKYIIIPLIPQNVKRYTNR